MVNIYTIIEKIVLNTLKAIFSDWTSRIIGILISFILIRDFNIDKNYQSLLIIFTTFMVVNIIDFSIRTPVFLYTKKHFTKKVNDNTQI